MGQRCMRAQVPTVSRSSGQYRYSEPKPKGRMAVAKCGALGWQDGDMRAKSVKKAEAVWCQPSTMTVKKGDVAHGRRVASSRPTALARPPLGGRTAFWTSPSTSRSVATYPTAIGTVQLRPRGRRPPRPSSGLVCGWQPPVPSFPSSASSANNIPRRLSAATCVHGKRRPSQVVHWPRMQRRHRSSSLP